MVWKTANAAVVIEAAAAKANQGIRHRVEGIRHRDRVATRSIVTNIIISLQKKKTNIIISLRTKKTNIVVKRTRRNTTNIIMGTNSNTINTGTNMGIIRNRGKNDLVLTKRKF
jgi:hypothetical protein